jgi:hypothetical protein
VLPAQVADVMVSIEANTARDTRIFTAIFQTKPQLFSLEALKTSPGPLFCLVL